jgi:hypothetical protein
MDLTSAVVLTLTRRVQSTRRNTQHSQRGLGTSGTGVCVCQMPEAVRGMGRRRENWVEVERSKCSTDCRRHDRCLQPPATQGINLPGQNTAACSIPAISRGDPASPLSQPKVGQHPPRSFSAESPPAHQAASQRLGISTPIELQTLEKRVRVIGNVSRRRHGRRGPPRRPALRSARSALV